MRFLVLVASALLVSPALADEALTRAEVEAFLTPLPDRARTAVEARNWLSIIRWLEEHLADEAPVTVSGELVTTGGATLRFDLSTTGGEYKYITALTTVMPQMVDVIENVRGYAIDMELGRISELADGTASAHVVVTETAQFDLPADFEGIGRPGPLPRDRVLETIHDCRLRLVAGDPDPTIVMMSCKMHGFL